MDEAFNSEFQNNWVDAFVEVPERSVPRDANVITSHVVYKIKTDETGSRKLKARVVPHGNRDTEKDNIRKDSATAQLGVIRLLLSVSTLLGLQLATADIKGAYLQSGPIKRTIFVRPPKEHLYNQNHHRGTLWKLTKLPYGIVEAGRQWQKTVEDWMLTDVGLTRLFGIIQLFIRRNRHDKIVLIIAKVTDDILIGGHSGYIREFITRLQARFIVGKVVVGNTFIFNGCEIEASKLGNVTLSMKNYLDRVKPIPLSRSRKKMIEDTATAQEERKYRALAGTLLYLGNGFLPQAALVTSIMQQRLGRLKVEYLMDANVMTKELVELKPIVTYICPTNTPYIFLSTFTDASHPKDRDYGQTEMITGFRIGENAGQKEYFHAIDWTSQKQKRVRYSAYCAEVLAATVGDDRGYYYKSAFNDLFPHAPVQHELNIDSKGLRETLVTLHEGRGYRLSQTIQRIRDSFEAHELDIIRWIPGTENIADALTKRNLRLYKRLNHMCTEGIFDVDLKAGMKVDSTHWD